jgi:hypothetical protein
MKNNKLFFVLFFSAFLFFSCSDEEPGSKGFLTIQIEKGPKLSAEFVKSPIPSSQNQFGAQATNRFIMTALFETDTDADFQIWTADKKPENIKVNKIYSNKGDWGKNQDDFDMYITIKGKDLVHDYREISFSKFTVDGVVEGTFKVSNKGLTVATGEFKFNRE